MKGLWTLLLQRLRRWTNGPSSPPPWQRNLDTAIVASRLPFLETDPASPQGCRRGPSPASPEDVRSSAVGPATEDGRSYYGQGGFAGQVPGGGGRLST